MSNAVTCHAVGYRGGVLVVCSLAKEMCSMMVAGESSVSASEVTPLRHQGDGGTELACCILLSYAYEHTTCLERSIKKGGKTLALRGFSP